MTSIQQRLATGRGKFTTDYPELGTAPVSYEDSISEGFFAAERKAVFERNWLCVGRIERLPRKGSYFTRDLPGRLASIVIARDLNDTVHAFHNVCAHRGNKVVWQEHPGKETAGTCRSFACKYHGRRYGLDGKVNHVTNEGEFFDLDKSTLRMPPVHCEVWPGFIFVNLASELEGVPVPLRDFLGDRLLPIEAYFLNRGNIASWGDDQFWFFPNISIQIWARGYYITYTYWPETVDSHIYEIDTYFVPPANAAQRLAQELVVDSTIEFAMQDVNTIEATHSALKTRAQHTFHLSDQELLIRQFHTVIRDAVSANQAAYRTGEPS